MIFQRSKLFSTGYPQVFINIHRLKPTHGSVDFPCFRGSAFDESLTFKALYPVDNSFGFSGIETAHLYTLFEKKKYPQAVYNSVYDLTRCIMKIQFHSVPLFSSESTTKPSTVHPQEKEEASV